MFREHPLPSLQLLICGLYENRTRYTTVHENMGREVPRNTALYHLGHDTRFSVELESQDIHPSQDY